MLSKFELQTIAQLIDSLDYYRTLKVPAHASEEEIRNAFHREALLLHPDRYQPLNDEEALKLSRKIYSKVVEAYRTLCSTERRMEYDKKMKITAGSSGHSSESSSFDDDNEITAVRRKEKPSTATAGLRFFKMAQAAFQARDLKGAKMNVQIALNADPDNPEYLELSQRIEIESQRKK